MADGDLRMHTIPKLEGLDPRKEIGCGAYGAVYEVKMNGLPCIAKGLHQILSGVGRYNHNKEGGEAYRTKFLQECSLLSKLKHPNIVQFLGIHRTKENDVLLVMEYMHMDLAKYLDTHPDIPLPLKLSILLDVSYGLLHMHSQTPPIIHRDLTAANVLLTEGLRAKIADLGVSKIFDLHQVTHTVAPGTHTYMPPEALMPTPQYGTKLDVFSFGVLSLYTANQKLPSVHEPPMNTTIVRNKEVQIFKRKHWIDQMGEDHILYPLVIQCLQDLPDQRPSTKELNDKLSGLCTQHPKKEILEAFTENFRHECESVDTTKAAAGRCQLQLQLEKHKIEWEANKAEMQLVIDDLKKDNQLKNERLQSSEEVMCHLKAKLEEKSHTELQTKKDNEEIKQLTQQLNSMMKNRTYTEACMQEQTMALTSLLKETITELETAKEEIAVKVAQVKQYQKQVEAYKQSGSLASQASASGSTYSHIDSDDDLPPPVVLPKAFHPPSLMTDIPLDPNLMCPICRRKFRKGEIQLYKQHVELCLAQPLH